MNGCHWNVRNNLEAVFNFKLPSNDFQLMSSLYIIFLSPVKVVMYDSRKKYVQFKQRLQASKQMSVDFDVRGQQSMDFFIGESLIVDLHFGQKQLFGRSF